jgi:hypothetical protein
MYQMNESLYHCNHCYFMHIESLQFQLKQNATIANFQVASWKFTSEKLTIFRLFLFQYVQPFSVHMTSKLTIKARFGTWRRCIYYGYHNAIGGQNIINTEMIVSLCWYTMYRFPPKNVWKMERKLSILCKIWCSVKPHFST